MIHLFGLIEGDWVYLRSSPRGLVSWHTVALEMFLQTEILTTGW